MAIGLWRGTVALEPHNPEWETAAQQTVDLLKKLLQETAEDVQHIGSTSVRGICAKPIIDIVIGAAKPDAVLEKNDLLAKNGFLFRGQDHPEQYLYVCGKGDFITHHIHVTAYRSEYWNNYINMRDYLNSCAEAANAYAALKKTLAAQYPDNRKTYTEMKSALIQELLCRASEWRRLQSTQHLTRRSE